MHLPYALCQQHRIILSLFQAEFLSAFSCIVTEAVKAACCMGRVHAPLTQPAVTAILTMHIEYYLQCSDQRGMVVQMGNGSAGQGRHRVPQRDIPSLCIVASSCNDTAAAAYIRNAHATLRHHLGTRYCSRQSLSMFDLCMQCLRKCNPLSTSHCACNDSATESTGTHVAVRCTTFMPAGAQMLLGMRCRRQHLVTPIRSCQRPGVRARELGCVQAPGSCQAALANGNKTVPALAEAHLWQKYTEVLRKVGFSEDLGSLPVRL